MLLNIFFKDRFLILIIACIICIFHFRFSEYEENLYFYVTDGNISQLLDVSDNDNRIPIIIWWASLILNVETSSTLICGNASCKRLIYPNHIPMDTSGAYLFEGLHTDFEDLPLPRNQRHIWGLYHDESPRGKMQFMHETILKLFNYSSTFSRHSDLPFPLQFLESLSDVTSTKYYVKTSVKNSMLEEISPILFIQSDCDTLTERDLYVSELMALQPVDSYGNCLNNKTLPFHLKHQYRNHLGDKEFLKFVARYKFVIAIENAGCEDYITEKFWRPIHLGVVPIYFGSPSIRDWLPNKKSAILLEDYPTPELMSQHLNLLMSNDELYEQYLEHKIKGKLSNDKLISEFKLRPFNYDFDKRIREFECFVCKKLHNHNEIATSRVVNKDHYNCPMPISALGLSVNPKSVLVNMVKKEVVSTQKIYNRVRRFTIDVNITT